jgi:hypothetical protein
MTLRAIRLPFCALAFLTLLFKPFAAHAVEQPDPKPVSAVTPPEQDADQRSPSVEWPLKHLYCVEYARLRSGLAIFGDARQWWDRARNLYDEFATPAVDAVMVFAGSKRIRKGHVAVVTEIVSKREIIVDHANWQNQGEIDRNMPVLDVSASNDWSRVRVWDVNSGGFGAHVYAIKGFIAGHLALARS